MSTKQQDEKARQPLADRTRHWWGLWHHHASRASIVPAVPLRHRIVPMLKQTAKQVPILAQRVAEQGLNRAKAKGAAMANRIISLQRVAGAPDKMITESARRVMSREMTRPGDEAWRQAYVAKATQLLPEFREPVKVAAAAPAGPQPPAPEALAPEALAPERPRWPDSPHIDPRHYRTELRKDDPEKSDPAKGDREAGG